MLHKNQINALVFLSISFLSLPACLDTRSRQVVPSIESELIPLSQVDSTILQEIRYAGTDNFMGKVAQGYEDIQSVLIQPSAADALKLAQVELAKRQISLLVYDAYRPQIAVDHFVEWSLQPEDTLMKGAYYPDIDKPNLFELGYIARESSHTTGYTVDLTLVDLQTGLELDMGSPFDFFGPISHHGAPEVTPEHARNRLILRSALEEVGFSAYEKEWWHYRYIGNKP